MTCMVHLAAFCGLRQGEILGLTVENVDLDRRAIRVRKSLSMVHGLKGPKTAAGNRDVPMPSHVAEMIRAWLARYFVRKPDDLVFPHQVRDEHSRRRPPSGVVAADPEKG